MPYVVEGPDSTQTFDDKCAMLRYLDALLAALPADQRGVLDDTEVGLDRLRSDCSSAGIPDHGPVPAAWSPIVPISTALDGIGVGGTSGPPPAEETPASLGAPAPRVTVQVDAPPRSPGERDLRTLNEQYLDPEAPMPDYEVEDHLRADGLMPDQVAEEQVRVRRNLPPRGKPHPMFAAGPQPVQTEDPVNLFDGQFSTEVSDVAVPSVGRALSFTRRYRSSPSMYGPLGFGWDHDYNVLLRPLTSGGVAIWNGHHSEHVFALSASGGFEAPRGTFQELVHEPVSAVTPERYRLRHPDLTVFVFERPPGWPRPEAIPLARIEDPAGNAHRLLYDALGRLDRVEDGDGRHLAFTYDSSDRITGVVDRTGRTWTYGYDENDHLVGVTTPPVAPEGRGLTTCYEYDREEAHPALVHNIVRILDAAGCVVVENEFGSDPSSDDFGRVVEQRYGPHVACFTATTLQHVDPGPEAMNVPSRRVETVSERGHRVFTFNFRGNLLDERFRLVRDGSYRVVARSFTYDDQGNQVEAREPNGLTIRRLFDHANPNACARGNLLRVTLVAPPTAPLASREVLRLTYESRHHQVKTIRQESGAITTLIYDYEVSATDRGAVVAIEHPGVSLSDGTVQRARETYKYDSRGRIRRRTSAEGHVFEYEYFGAGAARGYLRRTVAGPGVEDQAQSFEYDSFGNVSKVRDAADASTEFEWDALERLTRTRRPDVGGMRGEVKFIYGLDGRVAVRESPRGAAQTGSPGEVIRDEFEYDVLGRMTRATLGANTNSPRTWRLCSHTSEGVPCHIVDPSGTAQHLEFDERHVLLRASTQLPTGEITETRFVYDRLGNLTASIDPTGIRADQTFDPWGRLHEVELPGAPGARTKVRYEYVVNDWITKVETTGRPTPSAALAVLSLTRMEYDERGRLKGVEEAGRRVRFVHDRDSRILSIEHPRGATVRFEVDALGRVTRAIDALSNEVRRKYDSAGDLVLLEEREVPPGGGTPMSYQSTFRYDARGRLKAVRDALGNETTLTYDDCDRLLTVVDPVGNRAEYDHDFADDIIGARAFVAPGAAPLEHRWYRDAIGRVTTYRTPEGRETKYAYGIAGRWCSMTLPDGSTWARAFDAAGRVVRETSPSGEARVFQYGDAGLVNRCLFEDPAGMPLLAPVDYAYDGIGNPTSARQGASLVEWVYDAAGRQVEEKTDGVALRWAYDDAAGRADLAWPDGQVDRHEFDVLGRLKAIRPLAGAGAPARPPLVEYEYFGPERVHLRRLGSGCTSAYEYDAGRRLTRLVHRAPDGSLLTETEYAHDAAGRRRLTRTSPAPGTAILHDYDGLSRLVAAHGGVHVPPAALSTPLDQTWQDARIASVSRATASRRHEFVLNGDDGRRRRTLSEPSSSLREALDLTPTQAIFRLVRTVDGVVRTTVFAYDTDGRRRADDRYRYEFDGAGRLTAVRDAVTNVVLCAQEFDAVGRPHRRVVAGKARRFVHFGARMLLETDDAGGSAERHLWGVDLDELVTRRGSSDVFFHQDGRGSLLAVSDSMGAVLERYLHDAFGATSAYSPSGAARPAPVTGVRPMFGGHAALAPQLCDLFDARARVYDAGTGQFLQRDRYGGCDSANGYVYAAHNPVDLVDPSGEVLPIVAAMVIFGALAGGVYSGYDAADHPERYRGAFSFRALLQVAGGAAVGASSAIMGEAVLGTMGLGSMAPAGSMAAGSTLSITQTFVVGGTVSAFAGIVWRSGFRGLFPEYVDPLNGSTLVTDYFLGGVISLAFRGAEAIGNPFTPGGRKRLEMSVREMWERVRIWHQRGLGDANRAQQIGRDIAEIRVGREHADELVKLNYEPGGAAFRVPGEGQIVVFKREIDVLTRSSWIQVKASENATRVARFGRDQAQYTAWSKPEGMSATYYLEPGPKGIPRGSFEELRQVGITDVRPLTPELRGTVPFPLPFGGTSGLPFAELPVFLLRPRPKQEPGSFAPGTTATP